MKRYINYIKESMEDDCEELFLDYAHLDDLEIKFNFIEYRSHIFYFYEYK